MSNIEGLGTQKAALEYWSAGTEIIERCLQKAVEADPLNVPMPLVGDEALLWHRAQMEAYRHALEMMGVPVDSRASFDANLLAAA